MPAIPYSFGPGEQAEVTSSGCRRSAFAITFGTTMPLDLVDEHEQRRDPETEIGSTTSEGEDRRRHRREPGTDIGDHLDHGRPEAEGEGVLVGARNEVEHAEDPHAEPRAAPMIVERRTGPRT